MTHPLASPILDWYAAHQRDLPWRRPEATPWAILVSEVMLQQTPVSRVLPVYGEWLARWPRPADLAAAPAGEAVRAWGRLGYPRRAIRLHLTARALVDRHEGQVPVSLEALRALPGIGAYTAAAVASFAFGQRHAVLDTNVRRVLGRVADGRELPPPSPSAGRTAAGGVAAARVARGGRALVCRGHGTGRAGLHRGPARVPVPVADQCASAPGGPSAWGRPAAQPGL